MKKLLQRIPHKGGFFLGLSLFLLFFTLPAPEGLSREGMLMAGVAALMASWWISEAVPIPVTALVPLALYPLLGIEGMKGVAPCYTHHIIFLLMGGFILAISLEKWNLHKRITFHTLRVMGLSLKGITLGFMVATAFLSMWISNTATTMMMFPIGVATVKHVAWLYSGEKGGREEEEMRKKFGTILMLAIAYAASAGGTGTLIGTTPNILFSGFLAKLYPGSPEIGFLQWMLFGLPFAALFIPIAWLILINLFGLGRIPLPVRNGSPVRVIEEEIKGLGRISTPEKRVLILFGATVFLWVFRAPITLGDLTIPGWSQAFGSPSFIQDSTVAMMMALILFLVPSGDKGTGGRFLMDWDTFQRRLPWGILLLLGGGFALAHGFEATGLAKWIGERLTVLGSIPVILMIASISFIMTFLTEVTSNTAMATMMMPILGATAVGMKTNPILLMLPGALSASCAFMLPVATPPNAIVFGSGLITMKDMAKAGVILNFTGILLITMVVYLLGISVFGIDPSILPSWAEGG